MAREGKGTQSIFTQPIQLPAANAAFVLCGVSVARSECLLLLFASLCWVRNLLPIPTGLGVISAAMHPFGQTEVLPAHVLLS